MNKGFRAGIIFVLALSISGCATWKSIKPEKTTWKQKGFMAELPAGWAKSRNPDYFLWLTHHGVYLQFISVSKTKTRKELEFSKKVIDPQMLVHDIAQVVIDEMKLNKYYNNLEIFENKPWQVDVLKAFRLVYTFTNEEFVRYKVIKYGFVLSRKYYEIQYQATVQHNFDKYLPDFEGFIDSFRVIKRDEILPEEQATGSPTRTNFN